MREAIPRGSCMMEAGEGVCWRMRGGGGNTGNSCSRISLLTTERISNREARHVPLSFHSSLHRWMRMWAWSREIVFCKLLVLGPWRVAQAEGALGSGWGQLIGLRVFPFRLEKDARKRVSSSAVHIRRVCMSQGGSKRMGTRRKMSSKTKEKVRRKVSSKREKSRSSSTREIWMRGFNREGCSVGAVTTHGRRQSFLSLP